DYHSLHRENPDYRFLPEREGDVVIFRPYDGVPGVRALSNGSYEHCPDWYRNFLYEDEKARGLEFAEDLAAPGVFTFDLAHDEAALVLAAEARGEDVMTQPAAACARRLRASEKRRRGAFAARLERSADDYFVKRDGGKTIVAGYPWFTDWGRDTFISMRGLAIATGRLEVARDIL